MEYDIIERNFQKLSNRKWHAKLFDTWKVTEFTSSRKCLISEILLVSNDSSVKVHVTRKFRWAAKETAEEDQVHKREIRPVVNRTSFLREPACRGLLVAFGVVYSETFTADLN